MKFTASQIAAYLSGIVEGDEQVEVDNVSKIEEGVPGTLTFLSNPKYAPFLYTTNASIVLLNKDYELEQPVQTTLIRVDNAYECLAKLLQLVASTRPDKTGIESPVSVADSATLGADLYLGAFSYIGESSSVGDRSRIYPQVYIGNRVSIGEDCVLYPGVKILDDCIIGDRCVLQAGCVIGGDGFGFAPQAAGDYKKIPQIGNVILESDVELGANTTIDRATMGSTILRRGVKLDNLIQVAHNVVIGENTVMAAQVGIAGSTKIGANCMIGGQVGIAGHIQIADGVHIAAQTGVANSLKSSLSAYMGTPAIEAKQYAKAYTVFKKLPELYPEISNLIKERNK